MTRDLVLVGALLLLATRASADTWSSAPAQGGLGQASPAQGGAGCGWGFGDFGPAQDSGGG